MGYIIQQKGDTEKQECIGVMSEFLSSPGKKFRIYVCLRVRMRTRVTTRERGA